MLTKESLQTNIAKRIICIIRLFYFWVIFKLGSEDLLENIAKLLKTDYGVVYTPQKIANKFNITSEEAENYLETLVKKELIEKLSYGTIEPNFRLYCCNKPR